MSPLSASPTTASSSPVLVTLLGKAGCHLCDDARAVINDVITRAAPQGLTVDLQEVDILSDSKLARLYGEEIPVVMINGKRHAIWRVDPSKFAVALEKAAGRRGRSKHRFLKVTPPVTAPSEHADPRVQGAQ